MRRWEWVLSAVGHGSCERPGREFCARNVLLFVLLFFHVCFSTVLLFLCYCLFVHACLSMCIVLLLLCVFSCLFFLFSVLHKFVPLPRLRKVQSGQSALILGQWLWWDAWLGSKKDTHECGLPGRNKCFLKRKIALWERRLAQEEGFAMGVLWNRKSRRVPMQLFLAFKSSHMSDGQNYWLTYLVTAWP